MSPPDVPVEKQERRHRGPLIGMILVVVFGVGLIFYWIAEAIVQSPESGNGAGGEPTPAEVREGTVDVPPEAPTTEVEPEPTEGEAQQ